MKNTGLILVLIVLSACATSQQRPLLRIATDATFAPFHFIDDAGKPTGFDVELARIVAEHAGFEAEFVVLSYAELFAGLSAGTHAVVAATTGITAERQQKYLFSQPYFSTCQVAVVRNGPAEPQRYTDLRGLLVGAAGAGTSASAMRSIDATHVALNDGEGVPSLLEGKIDAWIVDEFDGIAAASAGQLHVLATGVANEQYGFVLAGDRTLLQLRLNNSLDALRHDGTLDDLRRRFGLHRGEDWPVACEAQ